MGNTETRNAKLRKLLIGELSLGTWSATQRFIEIHNTNPLEQIHSRLTEVWGNPESVKVARSRKNSFKNWKNAFFSLKLYP